MIEKYTNMWMAANLSMWRHPKWGDEADLFNRKVCRFEITALLFRKVGGVVKSVLKKADCIFISPVKDASQPTDQPHHPAVYRM